MIYTIGYQRLSLAGLQKIVTLNNMVLIDVRAKPYSRRLEFSRNSLEAALGPLYRWHGDTLGGKGQSIDQRGVTAIAAIKTKNVLLMCMEEAPEHCHRHHTICGPHFPDADPHLPGPTDRRERSASRHRRRQRRIRNVRRTDRQQGQHVLRDRAVAATNKCLAQTDRCPARGEKLLRSGRLLTSAWAGRRALVAAAGVAADNGRFCASCRCGLSCPYRQPRARAPSQAHATLRSRASGAHAPANFAGWLNKTKST